MPFTFSAGSFSFLKSQTSQPSTKQNNSVDNVNKNNNVNNLDMSTNHLSLNNDVNVIPLERRVHSLDDNSVPPKNTSRNSNSGNLKNTSRKGWYKSIFVRIHHTFSRWNDGDNDNNDNSNNDRAINNPVENDGSRVGVVESDACDDGPIVMKSRNTAARNSFIRRGNAHDFYIITKSGSLKNGSLKGGSLKGSSLKSGPLISGPLTSGPLANGSLIDDSLKSSRPSSEDNLKGVTFFEKYAKIPRHFAKEPEVLGKVGRFTILREREDFDTTYFDQCHCQQKPCRFSTNGCTGAHPVLPPELPELFKESDYDHSSIRLSQQQAAMIAHQQAQMQMAYSYSNKTDSWPSPSSRSRRSFYSNKTPSSNSSINSLPSLRKYNTNPPSIMISKSASPTVSTFPNSNPIPVILPHSSSSPNLVNLNQRSKIESMQNKSNFKSNNVLPNANIIVGGNSGKYPNNPQFNNNNNTTIKKQKFSLVNPQDQQRSTSMPPIPTTTTKLINSSSTPTTPTAQSKFSISHPNEPHTTINSHTGRKFEVEWNTSKSSSSSSKSSTSSSDAAYSPPSTISSVFSVSCSPDKKYTVNTLSRRCSTLSSKCGRKFEVTILSSSSSGNHSLLNASPHSTIGSVSSVISSIIDEQTKC